MDTLYRPTPYPVKPPTDLPDIHFAPTKYLKGALTLDDQVPPMQRGTFHEVFHTRYTTDAHFVAYQVIGADGTPNAEIPRLRKGILPAIRQAGSDVLATCIVLDFDNLGHKEWEPGGLQLFKDRLRGASVLFPPARLWTISYPTLHGFRLVYALDQPTSVELAESTHRDLCRLFWLHGFPEIDLNCSDWTRLFRLPYVVRENGEG